MINLTRGNVVTANAEALVNTVNCVGVMGKGVALQFKKAYPRNYDIYRDVCESGEMVPGKVLVTETGTLVNPKYIINFPTKRHWRGKSRIEDIKSGLQSLVEVIRTRGIKSIAIPPLGCGNGGLDWNDVRPLILDALTDVDAEVMLFEPGFAPRADEQPVSTSKPAMTRFKALLIKLFDRYAKPGYGITALEAQKLAWFLDRAGEPTRLVFEKGPYGPYSEALNYPLQEMDGHFILGSGDRSKVKARIVVLAGAVEQADRALLSDAGSAQARLDRIFGLIKGFETPYGMELLSTVDWIATRERQLAGDSDDVAAAVSKWSKRKARLFPTDHIHRTWDHLVGSGFIDTRS